MSADNWAVCPQCRDKAMAAYANEVERVAAMYGHVPVEEFDATRRALNAPNDIDFQTFREDYEFYGAEAGEVVADYSGHCSKCGLGIDFQERRRFYDRVVPEVPDA